MIVNAFNQTGFNKYPSQRILLWVQHLRGWLPRGCGYALVACLFMSHATANELTELLTGESKEKISDKVILKENSPQDDRKIRGRIQEIFTELDDLKTVEVAVSKGVVTLSGEIDSADIGRRALQYARQVEGVVEVENNLLITRNIERRVNTALERFRKTAEHLLMSLPLFILALLVVMVFWRAGRWLTRFQRFYQRLTPNAFIANLLSQIVRVIVTLMGIILALVLLDATSLIGTVLGAAGIVGLAIGFAIRDTVENYIASILLSLRNPFEPNDWVEIEGHTGSVLRLTSRATVLMTADGNHVRIPNAMVFKGIITNYTRNPMRRLGFAITINARKDIFETQLSIKQLLNAIEGVLTEPPAKTVIRKLQGDDAIIDVYGWVNQEQYSFSKVRSEAIRQVQGFLQGEDQRLLQHKAKAAGQDLGVEYALDKQLEQDREHQSLENLLQKDAPKEL